MPTAISQYLKGLLPIPKPVENPGGPELGTTATNNQLLNPSNVPSTISPVAGKGSQISGPSPGGSSPATVPGANIDSVMAKAQQIQQANDVANSQANAHWYTDSPLTAVEGHYYGRL